MADWSNWAGNQQVAGVEMARPSTADELAALVVESSRSGRGARPIGSGHSFTAIGAPRDVQVSLDRMSGLVAADPQTGLVTVRGGTRLRDLNRALEALGLAMTNLGDIEEQTIAGALATGTHGTGARFGGLATQVRGLELLTADGETLTCTPDRNPEVLDLARIGLGALGIVTAVTLQTEPLFALTAVEGGAELADVMAAYDEHADGTDHFEFYWFPHTTKVLTKHNTRRPLDPDRSVLAPLPRVREWWDDEFLSNTVFGAVVGAGEIVPDLVRPLAKVAASALSPREFTDLSHRVFTSPRRVRFCEMEYAVPRTAGMDVLRELVDAVERSEWRISFPVEVRVAAADDVPLSTAYRRDTVYLAIHTSPRSADRADYFATFERIAGQAGGRPHWGKLHSLDAASLRERHPRLGDFVALRDRLDPGRVFGNDHLATILG